jgi:hypothetical protein
MAITYTWSVTNLLTWDTDVCQNAVHEAAWKVTADDGTNTSEVTGSTAFADPTGAYIDYADLTETDIIAWIKNTLGPLRVAESENAAASGLSTNSYVDKPLPWEQAKSTASKKV